MGARKDVATLIPGETVIRRMRPHWIVLVAPVFFLLLSTTVFVWALQATVVVAEPYREWLCWATSAVYAILVLRKSVRGIVRWATTKYLFTSKRVVTVTGLISISGESIALNKIQSVQFHKTLLERFLGSGSLLIESAAENDIVVSNVTNAEKIHHDLYQQISEIEDAAGTAHARAGAL